jgi:hypothetical protein
MQEAAPPPGKGYFEMLLTLVGLAALSVASAFWLRIEGFTMMMSVILLALVFVFSNEFASFGRVAAYTFLALLVMQVGYFAGILLRLLLSYCNKDEAGAASKKAVTDKPTIDPQKHPNLDRTKFRTAFLVMLFIAAIVIVWQRDRPGSGTIPLAGSDSLEMIRS